MVENATRLHDGHPLCMDTALRVPPGRSAGGSRDLVAFLCPAPMAGLFFARIQAPRNPDGLGDVTRDAARP